MTYVISDNDNGATVLFYLKQRLCLSRKQTTLLKKRERGILLNGSRVTVRAVLKCGDILELDTDDSVEDINEFVEPVELPLDIIYEDDDIIAVNKPGGMPTHTSLNHRYDTLANSLAFYFKDKMNFVFRAVGRLDKDTSGVVLVAKNRRAGFILSSAIAKGDIKKEYTAILNGYLHPDEGIIEAPIARKAESIIERVIRSEAEGGQYARTDFKVVSRGGGMSLVLASPITGRTHQLRVHFSHIGHYIMGDTLYGPRDADTVTPRQALHCNSLTFTHPTSGERMTVTAELHDDMKILLNKMSDDDKSI